MQVSFSPLWSLHSAGNSRTRLRKIMEMALAKAERPSLRHQRQFHPYLKHLLLCLLNFSEKHFRNECHFQVPESWPFVEHQSPSTNRSSKDSPVFCLTPFSLLPTVAKASVKCWWIREGFLDHCKVLKHFRVRGHVLLSPFICEQSSLAKSKNLVASIQILA